MALTVQNLRAVGTGVEPASLLPGQIAFNVTDKVLYVGDGTSFKTSFDGTQVVGVPGNGWYSMPMDFDSLGEFYVANPSFYGDLPTDQQVLTWSTGLGHPIWTSGGGGGGSFVYVVTNAAVAGAPGTTVSEKITAAIGVASPDEGNVTIVTGIPDDVYEGLYFFTTEWVRGASYAYPSASEVIYDNTAHPGLTATVQGAIDDLDDGLAATTAIANTANSTANSALSIASAALPRAGGTMTGTLLSQDIDVQGGYGVLFNGGAAGTITGISGSLVSTSNTVAASSNAVKAAYDIGNAALPRSGGTMTGTIISQNINVPSAFAIQFNGGADGSINGINNSVSTVSSTVAASSTAVKIAYDLAAAALSRGGGTMIGPITFSAGQTFPVSGIQDATASQKGVVQIGTNIDVAAGVISVKTATSTNLGLVSTGTNIQNTGGVISVLDSTTMQPGVVQLNDTLTSTSMTQALTANQGRALSVQISALTISGTTTLAGSIDASNGLLQTVTTQGAAAGFAVGFPLPAPAGDPSPPGNNNYYVIVTAPGTFTPPSSPSVTSENGDWILSNGVVWQELEVGARPSYASTCVAGIVQLADDPATIAGVDGTLAVTALGLQSKVSDSINCSSSNRVASSAAVKCAYDLANAALPRAGGTLTGDLVTRNIDVQSTYAIEFAGGSNGTLDGISDSVPLLSSTSAASSAALAGVYTTASNAIPCSTITSQGEIIVADLLGSPTALPIGTDGQVLVVNTACNLGVEWVDDAPGDVTGVSGTAPITVNNTNPQTPIVGISAATTAACGAVQLNNTVTSTSVSQAATANAAKTAYDAGIQGQTNAAAAQATANQAVLDAAAAQATADAAVPCSSFTVPGQLLAGTGTGTYSALSVGANGQVLSANSACGTGLEWCTLSLACVPCSAYTAVGTILAGNGAGTYCSLPVGSNGQVLVPNSTCAAGVEWITCQGVAICGYTCTASPFNTAIGANAGDSFTFGVNNTLLGYNAGTAIAGGLNNTFVGFSAGDGITSSDNSVAVGSNALGNTGGNNNTAVGYCTGGCLTSGGQNTFIGGIAGYRATTLDNAVAVGYGAMGGVTTGTGQVAVGSNALAALTSGAGNVAVGYQALDLVTTGGSNTAVGHQAGTNVATNVNGNTLVGFQSGTGVTTGGQNTLIGNGAGSAITTGANNTILGNYNGTAALANNVVLSDGAGNRRFQANNSGAWSYDGTNFGTAGQFLASQGSTTTPVWCTLSLACVPCSAFTASGQLLAGTGSSTFTALNVGTDGQLLVADSTCTGGVKWATECFVNDSSFTGAGAILAGTGVGSFSALTVGTNGQFLTVDSTCANGVKWVTANGANICGFTCSATPFNTVVGSGAGAAFTSLSVANTAFGYAALDAETSGDFNVAIGHNALTAQNGASGNTVVGGNAGAQISSGSNNTLIGCGSGDLLTTGAQNVALGVNTLGGATTGSSNIAIGFNALAVQTTTSNNVAIGTSSGTNVSSGTFNTFVGGSSGQAVTSGSSNSYFGYAAGCNATTGFQNSIFGSQAHGGNGSCNVFVGYNSGCATTASGNTNTAIGWETAKSLTTGASNTFVGQRAGQVVGSGAANTFVGQNAGGLVTTGGCNTLVGAYQGTTTLSNNVVLSDGAGNIKLQVNENGAVGVGTTPSYGTAGQVLKSSGTAAAPAWSSATYGSFSSSQVQTNLDTTNGNAVTLNSTASSNGVSIVSGTQVTASVAGVYNIQISLQFEKTDAGTDTVEVWFKKSGTNIANSNTSIQLEGNGAKQLFALNLVEPLTAGQNLEVWWYSADVNVQLTAVAAGTRPAIPSAIVTLVPVGA